MSGSRSGSGSASCRERTGRQGRGVYHMPGPASGWSEPHPRNNGPLHDDEPYSLSGYLHVSPSWERDMAVILLAARHSALAPRFALTHRGESVAIAA